MGRHYKPDPDDLGRPRRGAEPGGHAPVDAAVANDGVVDLTREAEAWARQYTPAVVGNASAAESVITPPRRGGGHRVAATRHSGRTVVLSVATGALMAAGTSTAHATPSGDSAQVEIAPRSDTDPVAAALETAPQVLATPAVDEVPRFVGQLAKAAERAARAAAEEAARVAAEAAARRPPTFSPVSGTLTSNYGPRWGTTHNGLDIANAIGTPIFAVTDGTVIESGPASGFGLWVRILQDDGTIGVFGHINETLVQAGQKVRAGDQIATVGNRGQSTGPHLHYEVWRQDGSKADPMAWLTARGVQIQSSQARS